MFRLALLCRLLPMQPGSDFIINNVIQNTKSTHPAGINAAEVRVLLSCRPAGHGTPAPEGRSSK